MSTQPLSNPNSTPQNSVQAPQQKAKLPLVSVALFQPDMPQNVGAAMRLCACMGVGLHIIEPCGFLWKEKEFRRSGMDYRELVHLTRHASWQAFQNARLSPSQADGPFNAPSRLVLMTTKGAMPLYEFEFQDHDILLMGQESKGAPDHVHESVDGRVLIPMHGAARSLNIVNACAVSLGEAIRQTCYAPSAASPATAQA